VESGEISVHIGRIELVQPAPQPPRPTRPLRSFDDFLYRRRR
jgi:hypothetical protein